MGIGAVAGGLAGGVGAGVGGLTGATWGGIAGGAVNGGGMAAVNGGGAADIFAGAIGGALIGGSVAFAGGLALQGLGNLANNMGMNLVQGHGNVGPNDWRLGGTANGWLRVTSTEGFSTLSRSASSGNTLRNISMSAYAAFTGNWGAQRIPVGHITEVNDIQGGFYKINNNRQIRDGANKTITPNWINQSYVDYGGDPNLFRMISINEARIRTYTMGNQAEFFYNGNMITTMDNYNYPSDGSYIKVPGYYNVGYFSYDGLNPIQPRIATFNNGRAYVRYGSQYSKDPWWYRLFFK